MYSLFTMSIRTLSCVFNRELATCRMTVYVLEGSVQFSDCLSFSSSQYWRNHLTVQCTTLSGAQEAR